MPTGQRDLIAFVGTAKYYETVAAPDPLNEDLLKAAASAGLDETAIIRMMIAQAGSD